MAPVLAAKQQPPADPRARTLKIILRDYYGPSWGHPGGPWLGPGAIAAIVLGSIAFLALVACLFCWPWGYRGRRSRRYSRGRNRSRAYYARETTYTQTGVRGGGGGGGGDGVAGAGHHDQASSDYTSTGTYSGTYTGTSGASAVRVTRPKKAKTKQGRRNRR